MQISEQTIISRNDKHKLVLHYEGDDIFSIINDTGTEETIIALTREELYDIFKMVFK